MESQFVNIGIMALLGGVGFFVMVRGYSRRAVDVLADLRDEHLHVKDVLDATAEEDDTTNVVSTDKKTSKQIELEELAKAGIGDPEKRRRMILWKNLTPIVAGFCALAFAIIKGLPAGLTFFLVSLGMGVGAIYSRRKITNLKTRYNRDIIFFLPIVMERIVMAVQAGLDIVPAITTATNFGSGGSKVDPVTALLKKAVFLTESGMIFENALKDTAAEVESSPLRHAFLHLAVAQKEGGILIMPLRELSDSTQLYYQESIEEEIAEMPVKATLPLICTFAGLLLCFLVPPFLQVLSILTENVPGGM
jgi:hypothetical protein